MGRETRKTSRISALRGYGDDPGDPGFKAGKSSRRLG